MLVIILRTFFLKPYKSNGLNGSTLVGIVIIFKFKVHQYSMNDPSFTRIHKYATIFQMKQHATNV